jgi:hypothetical protein
LSTFYCCSVPSVVPALVATGLLLAREARTQSERFDRRVVQVAGDFAQDVDRERR